MLIRKMKFSVLVSVGPELKEMSRVDDLATQLYRLERNNLHELILVDDSYGVHNWLDHLKKFPFLRVVPPAREGKGDPWRGGLTTNILSGLGNAFSESICSFVLKVDTDSFIVRPFFNAIKKAFDEDAAIGLLGSCYKYDPSGNHVPPSTWQINLKKQAKQIRFRRNPKPHIETALWGERKKIRQIILGAVNNGWPLGSCAQGGGYALSSRVFSARKESGNLFDSLLWRDTDIGEDVVVSMITAAAGYYQRLKSTW